MTEAVNNAKQVFYLLVEFDGDFGEFPSDATADEIMSMDGGPDFDPRQFKGEYSNDYLRQFIAGGYTNSEEIFYVKRPGSKKPDNVIDPPEKMLEAGECGFTYVKNQSTSDNSGRPLLITPMLGEGEDFDTGLFKGKAVALRIDGAVKQLLINEDGLAKVGEGKTLFQSGPGTVWGEAGFEVTNLCHPERTGRTEPFIRMPSERSPSHDVMMSILAIVIVAVVTWFIVRSRKRAEIRMEEMKTQL